MPGMSFKLPVIESSKWGQVPASTGRNSPDPRQSLFSDDITLAGLVRQHRPAHRQSKPRLVSCRGQSLNRDYYSPLLTPHCFSKTSPYMSISQTPATTQTDVK